MGQARVLVIASDAEAGELYATILASVSRARTLWVADTALARGLLSRRMKFDAVVVDVTRPSEWESCEALGREQAAPPVVMVTGWLSPDGRFRQRAFDAGCAAFIAKPFEPRTLAEAVVRVGRGERNISWT